MLLKNLLDSELAACGYYIISGMHLTVYIEICSVNHSTPRSALTESEKLCKTLSVNKWQKSDDKILRHFVYLFF